MGLYTCDNYGEADIILSLMNQRFYHANTCEIVDRSMLPDFITGLKIRVRETVDLCLSDHNGSEPISAAAIFVTCGNRDE